VSHNGSFSGFLAALIGLTWAVFILGFMSFGFSELKGSVNSIAQSVFALVFIIGALARFYLRELTHLDLKLLMSVLLIAVVGSLSMGLSRFIGNDGGAGISSEGIEQALSYLVIACIAFMPWVAVILYYEQPQNSKYERHNTAALRRRALFKLVKSEPRE